MFNHTLKYLRFTQLKKAIAVETLLEMGVKSPKGEHCDHETKEGDLDDEEHAWLTALGMDDEHGDDDNGNAEEDSLSTVDEDDSLDGSDNDVNDGEEDSK